MKLGAFSNSLSVKDIHKSKQFYEALGFEVFGGHIDQNWLIMKNGESLIGLFQGMFEKNMMTFNPGWDQSANNLDNFDDVRKIQSSLQKMGISLSTEVAEGTSGPGSFMLEDPDGNPILIDQHR